MTKRAKMADGEYDAAVAHVAALWYVNVALQQAHEAACTAWYDADARLKPETQAREIDSLVAVAMSDDEGVQ